jgi:hypothetical protein
MDKISVQRAFNNHFFEFFGDISTVFPENIEIASAKNSFETIKKMNPSAIIKAWYNFIYIPYNDIISDGNLSFFFDKDYSSDLSHLKNSDEFLKIIEKVREPLRNMDDKNKEHSAKYLKNLNKLSYLYSTFN